MSIREKITEFLNHYNDYITQEDLRTVNNFIKILDVYEIKETVETIYGEHFKDCAWYQSCSQDGPDTCHCVLYRFKERVVINIIEMYNKYPGKK